MGRAYTEGAEAAGWAGLSEISVPIRQRPELGQQNHNRIENMRRCATEIDGWLLPPRGIFSMRRAIGEPTLSRGFSAGPSLVDGALRDDIGGGICQVSTVLFNVALLAGLEILEKHNHSTDIWGERRLIELGRDAAFAYAIKDLKFRNPFAAPVSIGLTVAHDESALLGRADCRDLPPGPVAVHSQVLEELTPVGEVGPTDHAVPGWRVSTTRLQTVDGHETVTFERVETYRPTVARGTTSRSGSGG